MHNDIEFLSKDWGKRVEAVLSNQNIGACAVAGANYMRRSPSYYPIGGKFNVFNLLQAGISKETHWKNISQPTNVVIFDGLWFCIRKEMFTLDGIYFDEQHFHGFHFYDIDIATQIIQTGKQIVVLSDVIIKHYSGGCTDKSWLKDSFIYAKKWKNVLPLSCISIETKEAIEIEQKALYSSLRNILMNNSYTLLLPWFKFACTILQTTPLTAVLKILEFHNKK